MWSISKVLNSSVVLARDESGVETVLLGKGIGFGRKAGQPVDTMEVDQIFVNRSAEVSTLVDLLDDIPGWYLELAHEIVASARGRLPHDLDDHIYLTLTDHLHFMVQRLRDGLIVHNRLLWEMKTFYPLEHALGVEALARLRNLVSDVDIPEDESANIAFHLVNASRGGADFNAIKAVQLIKSMSDIVRYSLPDLSSADDLHWGRFVTHLQFFTERYLSHRLLDSEDDFLFTQMSRRYPQAVEVAEKIERHLSSVDGVDLPDEEVAYLALHIQRLSGNNTGASTG
ncbi:PRD domain-containing protein [Corynebacterium glyciniphilum]|uniref:PRD domain-containing protein n=1 Tax=Corynebacterium glyciniphilum TaxID=1404244 RepID=UPI003DA0C276